MGKQMGKEKAEARITLSARQQQVLSGVGAGESSKETAVRLKISVRTVEVHRARSIKVLGARTSWQAFFRAVDRGIIRRRAQEDNNVRSEF
jgi:DNA-binding NarL/FixJ family response regulator